MKKRIIAWAVLLSICAAALGLWCSAAAGKTARTLPCEEEGLILSITTFDGKSESKPFLKCFGHTWIGLDNRTGHTVYLKDRAIPDGEMVTFSVWAVSGLSGLLFDLEPCYIANYGRYTGRLSLSTNIGEEQLKVIEDYMEQHDKWTVDKNCSYWSVHLWNAVVGEDAALKIRGFVCTPEKIEQAFSAFDCVEVDKDFSRAGGSTATRTERGRSCNYVRKIHHKQAAAGHRVRSGGAVRPVQCNLLLCHPVQSGAPTLPDGRRGTVRFSGLLHDGRHARRHLPAFGGAGMALPQRNKKTAGKDRSPVNLQIFCNVFPLCALLG